MGALWLVFQEERGEKRCLGVGQSLLSKRAHAVLQVYVVMLKAPEQGILRKGVPRAASSSKEVKQGRGERI